MLASHIENFLKWIYPHLEIQFLNFPNIYSFSINKVSFWIKFKAVKMGSNHFKKVFCIFFSVQYWTPSCTQYYRFLCLCSSQTFITTKQILCNYAINFLTQKSGKMTLAWETRSILFLGQGGARKVLFLTIQGPVECSTPWNHLGTILSHQYFFTLLITQFSF